MQEGEHTYDRRDREFECSCSRLYVDAGAVAVVEGCASEAAWGDERMSDVIAPGHFACGCSAVL